MAIGKVIQEAGILAAKAARVAQEAGVGKLAKLAPQAEAAAAEAAAVAKNVKVPTGWLAQATQAGKAAVRTGGEALPVAARAEAFTAEGMSAAALQRAGTAAAPDYARVTRMMFPKVITTAQEAEKAVGDLASTVTRGATGANLSVLQRLHAADLPAAEKARVTNVAATIFEGIERAKAALPKESPQWKALNANWSHLKQETAELLEAAPKLGLKGEELADSLIASLMSDAVKPGADLRTVVSHDAFAAKAWEAIGAKFFPGKAGAARLENVRMAILEHQGVPPGFMSRFMGMEMKGAINASNLPNKTELLAKADSVMAKIADPYAKTADGKWAHLIDDGGRLRLKLDKGEQEAFGMVRDQGWHVPNPAKPGAAQGVVLADFNANYVSRNGVAKIVESFRGLGTGPMTADATVDDGFKSIVGTLTASGKVEGGSIGDGAKFLQSKELTAALERRAILEGDWAKMKADFAKPGGVLEQIAAKFQGRADNPITRNAKGELELPYWNKPLKYPSDNRNPLMVPEAKAAQEAMTPVEKAALEVHRMIQAEIGKWMRA